MKSNLIGALALATTLVGCGVSAHQERVGVFFARCSTAGGVVIQPLHPTREYVCIRADAFMKM